MMTIKETKRLADGENLDACQDIVQIYIHKNKFFEAFPYVKILADSGDRAYFSTLATLYCLEGRSKLGIGAPAEHALETYELGLEWAQKANNQQTINSAKQGIGECYFLIAESKEKDDRENSYLEAYNVLASTVGKTNDKMSDLIWAICADKLQDMGYNLQDNAITQKCSILIDSYTSRRELIEQPRAEEYLGMAAFRLGMLLLDGTEIKKNDSLAYKVFTALEAEFNWDVHELLESFAQNRDGTYSYVS